MLGDLHGSHAHTTGRRVHQDRLAALEPGEVDQGEVGGQEGDRRRGGLGERPAPRHAHDRAPVHGHQRAEPAADHAHDAVAGGQVGDVGGHLGDHTRGLQAHRPRLARVHAQRVEHVAEVQAGSTDRHPHVAGGQRRLRLGRGQEAQVVQAALVGGVQPPRPVLGHGEVAGGDPGQAARVHHAVADEHLWLARRDSTRQRLHGGLLVVHVDQQEPVRVLRLGGTDQAPQRGVGQVADVLADGAARDEHQLGLGEPLLGQPGLHQVQHGVDLGPHIRGQVAGGLAVGHQRQQHGVRGDLGEVGGGVDAECGGQLEVVVAEHGPARGGLRRRHGQRGPVDPVERVALRGLDAGDLAEHQ